jgi:hypothetical protein
MEDGLDGQLGLVAVKSVGEAAKAELGIAPIPDHHTVADIVLDQTLIFSLATMKHAYTVKLQINLYLSIYRQLVSLVNHIITV